VIGGPCFKGSRPLLRRHCLLRCRQHRAFDHGKLEFFDRYSAGLSVDRESRFNLRVEIQGDGHRILYAFSERGTCPSGYQSRTFAYDSLARLTNATNPESGATRYSYDKNGNLTSKTDANNNATALYYDGLNRVTAKNYTTIAGYSTPNVTYCYDGTNSGSCAGAPTGAGN
jgi:YD repeat-containing protein